MLFNSMYKSAFYQSEWQGGIFKGLSFQGAQHSNQKSWTVVMTMYIVYKAGIAHPYAKAGSGQVSSLRCCASSTDRSQLARLIKTPSIADTRSRARATPVHRPITPQSKENVVPILMGMAIA